MTTASEVKKWVGPLLERRPDLVLVGRNLIIKPVRHVVRGIFFDASWDKNYCRPKWYVNKICNHYGESPGFYFQYSGDFFLNRSSDPDFIPDLISKIEAVLSLDFAKILTISDFLNQTDPVKLNGQDTLKRALSSRPYHYATVLAALGGIAEAREVLAQAIEALEKLRNARLARAEAAFAKRANSAVGKLDLQGANDDLDTIAKLRPLLVLLESNDRAGIGALLRQWEEQTVKGWKLEALWEPTPFPVELGAGD